MSDILTAGDRSDADLPRFDASELHPYVQPIFGFALNRTGSRTEAEDLAQEIMLEALHALRKRPDIRNLDAYIWTIARYRWAHWAKRRVHAPRTIEINGMSGALALDEPSADARLMQAEETASLRRELAYLSDLHRRIVVMHYYEGVKQADIARRLDLPVGTVKWHLHDARKELKRRMNAAHEQAPLSVNPIRLNVWGHSGSPGSKGETGDFLGRPLAQNIVYAAYHRPRTVREIGEAIGVPPALLEEEVRYLADYAYLTETAPGRYQTNTIVWDLSAEQLEAEHAAYRSFAERTAERHFEALADERAAIEASGIYIPDNDYNFLLWTLVPKDLDRQAANAAAGIDVPDARPQRKDGGQYIALTSVDRGPLQLSFNSRDYIFSGPMTRGRDGSPLYLWMANHRYSEWRHWTDVNFRDVELCHAYRTGALPDDESNREAYTTLLERGYLLRRSDGQYTLNTLWADSPEVEARIQAAIPDLDDLYKQAVTDLYDELLELYLLHQPDIMRSQIKHMVKSYATGGPVTAYVLKHLVDAGNLREPLPHQRKTLSTWMGAIRY